MQENIAKEIVVVVNPSDVESERVVTEFDAKCIRTHRNLGAFPAKSLGIANSSAEYIMVVDDDAKFLMSDDVRNLLEILLTNPLVACVTCNTVGPCEGPIITKTSEVPLFKDGFTLYRRAVFFEIAGFVPDTFFRAGGESYYANYIYDQGYSIVKRHDVTMFHAQTIKGRNLRQVNTFAIRNHALLALMQEPGRIVLLSLARKVFSTAYRIGLQRRDPVSWIVGWAEFVFYAPYGFAHRRPITWQTYKALRQMRRTTSELSLPAPGSTDHGRRIGYGP